MFDKIRRKLLTVIPATCAYCPNDPQATVLWPDEDERVNVCADHGRFISTAFGEIELLTRYVVA